MLVGPTLERVNWVPVDFLTEVMVLQHMRRRSRPVAAFYLLNLYPSVWRVVALVIAEMYVGRRVVC